MVSIKQRSVSAYSAVLAHANYAGLDSASFETKIAELTKGMRVLCDEYGIDFDDASKLPE
jgi:hypothetical protein